MEDWHDPKSRGEAPQVGGKAVHVGGLCLAGGEGRGGWAQSSQLPSSPSLGAIIGEF